MKKDMTVGNPLKLILLFALPLFLSNLFQQFYNIADTAIVGHILGDEALSAVGSVASVYNLILSLCFGITNGFSIMISQAFGAKEEEQMKKAIAGTIKLSMIFAVIMTVLCCTFMNRFLQFLNIPKEVFSDAYTYIFVIVAGFTVTTFYNMLSSILRALGNSTIPLIFLIISSVLNIVLDFCFILGLHLKIVGAALATVLSQFISVGLCLIYIIKWCPSIHLCKADFVKDRNMEKSLISSGSSMGLMYAVVSVGTVILQSGINGLGKYTIAAHVAARKISEIYMMPSGTLANTMATYASQNYGAKRMDRVWKGVKWSNFLGWMWSIFVIVLTYVFSGSLILVLTGSENPEIIATGARYLKLNVPFYFILIELCILRSTLQGIGSRILPIVSSSLELLGKLLTVVIFIPYFGYTAVCFSEPFTWMICSVVVTLAFLFHPGVKKMFAKQR